MKTGRLRFGFQRGCDPSPGGGHHHCARRAHDGGCCLHQLQVIGGDGKNAISHGCSTVVLCGMDGMDWDEKPSGYDDCSQTLRS